jgi:uncharacterized protein YbjT (DUF2867 family)
MQIKVIITGSTGMVGRGVLLECLKSPLVDSVLAINRQPLELSHPKLKEICHKDFFNITAIKAELSGYNACFFCLGVSSAGISAVKYRHITFDLTLNFAKTLLELNPEMTFCYISGAGTDSTEKGRINWARIKGKTENDLLALGFKDAYMFRPGFIQPLRGIKSKTPLYRAIYAVVTPLYPLLKSFPGFVTSTETLASAMIGVVTRGYKKKVLESRDINQVVNT